MLRVSVWNPKGGVGKTTLSMNLSAAIMQKGKSVILADLDPQRSAYKIARDGNLPYEVVTEIPKGGYDVVVMDHPPGYIETPRSHVLIFPMRLARPDMEAGIKALKNLGDEIKKAVVVFNDIDFRRGVERTTWNKTRKLETLKDARLVKSRVVYRVALDRGRTVFDPVLDGNHNVAEARREILNILKK